MPDVFVSVFDTSSSVFANASSPDAPSTILALRVNANNFFIIFILSPFTKRMLHQLYSSLS